MSGDEKTCPKCAETVKAAAVVCRFCGHEFSSAQVGPAGAAATPPTSLSRPAKFMVGVVGLVAFLGVMSAIAKDDSTAVASSELPNAGLTTSSAPAANAQMPAESALGSAAAQVDDPAPEISGPRANAMRSAQQYISMSAFSREGLIDQLSSSAGEGYDRADAVAAVDSISVDWNEQAAKSAAQYLSLQGFSCQGLIEQLSSGAGEKFTRSQARYGAQQAGAC